MKTLHPHVPLVVAGLILIGASSLGPNSTTTSPIAESISPTMAPSDKVLAGAVEIDLNFRKFSGRLIRVV